MEKVKNPHSKLWGITGFVKNYCSVLEHSRKSVYFRCLTPKNGHILLQQAAGYHTHFFGMQIKRVLSVLESFQKQESMLFQFGRRTPFQILISTVLSARTKDTTTIPICKVLFERFPDAKSLANAKISVLEKIVYRIGFYKVKSKRIKELSVKLLEQYGGNVPRTLDELIELPGVGRKTANCVLVYAFRKPAIPVDVHVHRIANRFGWIKTKTPEESEQALMKRVPKILWVEVNEHLVVHGQTVCVPISPFCSKCPVFQWCERVGVVTNR